jgi:hypothetical protein
VLRGSGSSTLAVVSTSSSLIAATVGSHQAPARRLIRTLRVPERSIVGPVADLVCIYGSPIWALLAINVILAMPLVNNEVTIGQPTSMVAFLLAGLTFAHLLPVFVRSHLNPTIRRSFPWRMLAVPPALVAALTVWPGFFIVAGAVAGFWDVYHTAQQNFGLGRIYDARAGVADDRTRRADRIVSHALYLGPILAGQSMMEHLSEFDSLEGVGWTIFLRVPKTAQSWGWGLRSAIVLVAATIVVWYVVNAFRLDRQGAHCSPHKVVLMVTSAVIQIAAWGFSSPLVAFMVVNLYHAVQYFALVWHLEGRKAAGGVGIKREGLKVPFGVLVVFIIPALFGMAVSGVVTDSTFVNASFLSVSLLHFWMDGFIWSVRARTV